MRIASVVKWKYGLSSRWLCRLLNVFEMPVWFRSMLRLLYMAFPSLFGSVGFTKQLFLIMCQLWNLMHGPYFSAWSTAQWIWLWRWYCDLALAKSFWSWLSQSICNIQAFFFCLVVLIEMDFVCNFCAAATVVHAAHQLEEDVFANSVCSACVMEESLYFQVSRFCDAEGTGSELGLLGEVQSQVLALPPLPIPSDSLLTHVSNGSYVVLMIVETSLLMPLAGTVIPTVYKSWVSSLNNRSQKLESTNICTYPG